MDFDWFPLTLGWELTLLCNLHCKHCGSSAGQPRVNELTTKEALELCDQFPALLIQEVDFTGGEPLLRSDWLDIALHLKDLKIRTGIVTNGIQLDAVTVSKIKSSGVSHIAISIDGLESTHNYIRGGEVFQQTIDGMKRAIEADIPITVITTVTQQNINELPPLFELLSNIGIKRWRPQPLFLVGRSEFVPELHLNEQTYLQLIHYVQTLGQKAENVGIDVLRADGVGYYYEPDSFRSPWYGCPAGLVSVGITSDGKVKGCLSLPDTFIEGDLRKKTLWDIWFDPQSFKYTRQFSSECLGDNCRSCEKALQCRGGCSVTSYGSTGKFNNDPFCFLGIKNRKNLLEKA